MDAKHCTSMDSRDLADSGLCAEVRRVLDSSGYRALAHLECDAHSGIVIMRGVLPSFYLKQIAHALILRLDQVISIDDQIDVSPQRN